MPDELREQIEEAMARYPESARPPSRRCGRCSATTAGARRRDPPGGGGDGRDPRLPGVGRHLLRPLPNQPGGPPPGARLPQHLLLDARRRRAAASPSARRPGSTPHEADHGGASSPDGELFVKGFECLGACDLAPMASIDERYYGPLEPPTTPGPRSSSCARRRGAARQGARQAPRRRRARAGARPPRKRSKDPAGPGGEAEEAAG